MHEKNLKRMTMRGIAKHANVSPATVSRVLNQNDYPITKEIKELVLRSASELGYQPSPKKVRTRSNVSNTMGIIIPNISNPFYQEAVIAAQLELEKSNFNVILCNTFRREEKEKEYLAQLFKQGVPGVIYSANAKDKSLLSEYMVKGMKFVLLDQLVFDEEICTHVNLDLGRGAQIAVEHLCQNGHKNIAFASTPLDRWSRKILYEGFLSAVALHGLEFPDDYLLVEDSESELAESVYEYQVGFRLANEYLRRGLNATAVVAVNDMVAMGLIQGFASKGFNVPRDISVISFDNIMFSKIFTPALTTIESPAREIGRLAAQFLVEQVNTDMPRPIAIRMQPKLVKRDTVRNLLAPENRTVGK